MTRKETLEIAHFWLDDVIVRRVLNEMPLFSCAGVGSFNANAYQLFIINNIFVSRVEWNKIAYELDVFFYGTINIQFAIDMFNEIISFHFMVSGAKYISINRISQQLDIWNLFKLNNSQFSEIN